MGLLVEGSLAQVLSRSFPFFQSCWKVAWALAMAAKAAMVATVFILYMVVGIYSRDGVENEWLVN